MKASRTRAYRMIPFTFMVACGGWLHAARVSAQETAKSDAGAEHLAKMAAMARSVSITVDGSNGIPVTAETEPVVRYDDQPRHIEDATLWLFGHKGRPIAAMKIELYPRDVELYGLVSLAPASIAAKADDGWRWSATRPGLRMTPLPDAPAPARSERERLAQMKALARRFAGSEDDGPTHGKLALRLLAKPILRYADPSSGIEDGALFGLAIGTNPDILIVLEATKADRTSSPAWQYGLARTGGANLFVSLDGRQVWSERFAPIPARLDTYANRYVGRNAPGR